MNDVVHVVSVHEDLDALRGGITVERYAEVSAHIHHFSEYDRPAVVARFGLGTEAWMIACDAWDDAIMDDKSSTFARAYGRTYKSVRERLKREAPALDAVGTALPGAESDSRCFAGLRLRRYAEVLAHVEHFGEGRSDEVVARFGLTPKQWRDASKAWRAAMTQEVQSTNLWLLMETQYIVDLIKKRLQKENPDLTAVGFLPPPPAPPADPAPPPAASSSADPLSVPPPASSSSADPPLRPRRPCPPPARPAPMVPAPAPSDGIWSRFIDWLARLLDI